MKEFDQITATDLKNKKLTKVFVNGNWIGCTSDAGELYGYFKDLRRDNGISREISIVRDFSRKEIRFLADHGRVQRPLYIVENNMIKVRKKQIAFMKTNDPKLKYTFETFVR